MIQYYLDLGNQVKVLKEAQLSGGQIQKIYSTAYYISMAVRIHGKTWHLYLGRGAGHEGVWLHHKAPSSTLRRKDNFLEYLRRYLSSCMLLDVSLDPADRIIRLDYQKFGKLQSLLFFWKGRKLYFLHLYHEGPESPPKVLLSWRGKAVTVTEDAEDLFAFFNEIGRNSEIRHDLVSPHLLSMEELLELEVKAADLKGTSGRPTFLQRKKENIENDLRKARQWERLQAMLDREDSLEGYELKVGDQKIKFLGELNTYERRNLLHQKIKKLKRGEDILSVRLKDVEEELVGRPVEIKSETKLPIARPVWGQEEQLANKSVLRSDKNEYEVFRTDSCLIGVGLNSQGNDQLRNKWASKEDYWMHLDGTKSAHVILKLPQKATPDSALISLAASILAHFSRFNGDWIPIVYTQVKNLKGVTGAAGMVIYKKEKHLNCPKVDISLWVKE